MLSLILIRNMTDTYRHDTFINKKPTIKTFRCIYLINFYPLNFIHARYDLFSVAMHLKNETKTAISNILFPSITSMKGSLYSGIKIFINI